jgi:hypothetical protein
LLLRNKKAGQHVVRYSVRPRTPGSSSILVAELHFVKFCSVAFPPFGTLSNVIALRGDSGGVTGVCVWCRNTHEWAGHTHTHRTPQTALASVVPQVPLSKSRKGEPETIH